MAMAPFRSPVNYTDSPTIQSAFYLLDCVTVKEISTETVTLTWRLLTAGILESTSSSEMGTVHFSPPVISRMFHYQVAYVVQDTGRPMIAADFNGDGRLDLLASCGTGRFQCGDLLFGQRRRNVSKGF